MVLSQEMCVVTMNSHCQRHHRKQRKRGNTSAYLLVLSFNPWPLPFNWPSLPRSWGAEEPRKYFLWNNSRAGEGKEGI